MNLQRCLHHALPALWAAGCSVSAEFPTDRAPPSPETTLTLATGPLRAGDPATFVVSGGVPGELAYVAIGRPGVGRCLPVLGGGCLGVDPVAHVAGPAVIGPDGRATLRLTIPDAAPVGPVFGFEAWVPRGANLAASRSAVLSRSFVRPSRALDASIAWASTALTASGGVYDVALELGAPIASPELQSASFNLQLNPPNPW
jgi:hypothetical protein